MVSVEEVFAMDATGTDYYQTQYEILKSRTIARGVIERLNLGDSPIFNPPPKDDPVSRWKRWLKDWVAGLKDQVLGFVLPGGQEADTVRYSLNAV